MLQVDIGKVEVYTFHKHVGGNKHLRVGIMEHGTIVAHAFDGGRVLDFDIVGEMAYKAKLTEC